LVVLDRDFNHGRSKKSAYYNVQCDCGNKNVVLGRHLRQGTTISCGCINSKGEEEIAKILFENKIEFKKQYSFKNLKSKKNRLLKFDFAVFKDGKLSHLIEFDGEQHSDKTSRYYSETMVQNDNIKNKYCADNNIRLIRLTKDDSLTIDKLV
jgi:ribosomal protein S27E